MRLINAFGGRREAWGKMNKSLSELVEGISNQSELLDRKFEQVIEGQQSQVSLMKRLVEGISNQAELMNQKFQQLIGGQDHHAELLNRKFDQLFVSQDHQAELINRKFDQLLASEDHQAEFINRKFDQLLASEDHQAELTNRKFDQLRAAVDQQTNLLNRKFAELISAVRGGADSGKTSLAGDRVLPPAQSFDEAMQRMPLMIDDLTYNTTHPDYEAELVRNYPGKIFNRKALCTNFTFAELLRQAKDDEVADNSWDKILAEALVEASSVPGAAQVFERRTFIENYMAELGRKYHAHYVAGWVNLVDALFLYWLVRQTNPDKIVQCGACNGLSSSFMMLALAKNGPEGTLSIIDMPPVFDPNDPEWTEEGKAHGVCIPEGKTTAWMVPDIYRDRLEVWNGDAKDLLPKMLDRIEEIDFFYHDSDHTYRHMMFEFQQAKRKLSKGGVIVADDVSWNASLWDFADKFGVPAYNFKGTMGVAFF
jgi:predicted O-methyltransferase YrrM